MVEVEGKHRYIYLFASPIKCVRVYHSHPLNLGVSESDDDRALVPAPSGYQRTMHLTPHYIVPSESGGLMQEMKRQVYNALSERAREARGRRAKTRNQLVSG